MALSELPTTIIGANIKCTIFCQTIGYKAETTYNKLGIQSYSFAIGPPYIPFESLKKKASWLFECHIHIQNIIEKNNPLNDTIISTNNVSSQKSISWKFTDQLVNTFIHAAPNTDIPSELFSIQGCTFGLECTPNGYSGKVPVGCCGIWIGLHALPTNVEALQNVTLIAFCREVNFEVSVMVNSWNVPSNNYISIDFPKYISNVKFKYLSSWTFQCAIRIGNFIYYNNQQITTINSTSNVSMNNNSLAQQEQMTAQFLLTLLDGYQKISQNPMVTRLVNEGFDINDAIKAVTMSSDNNFVVQDKDKAFNQMIAYGFDKQTASIALDCCNHNVDQAIEFISQQHVSLEQNNKHDLSICDVDISECDCLKDLNNIMGQYDDSKDNYDHIRKEYNLIQIVDIYQHLLSKHDKDTDFEYIYNTLPKCTAKNCDKVKRNYRNRNDKYLRDYKGDDAPMIQILDKIHCYYKHTYQMGYRLTLKERNDINKECKQDINQDEKKMEPDFEQSLIDKTFKPLQSMIKKKKMNFPNDSGINIAKYKYNQLQNITSNEKMYAFGAQFFYEDRGNTKANVFAKYYSLKEELIINTIANVTKEQYDNEYAKAVIHLGSQYCKAKYFNIECPFTKQKVNITKEQLLVLMIYCNYDTFQHKFSKTYRENMNHHNSFYHFAKHLSDAVNIFGDNSAVNKFYHGISEKLSFPNIVGRYNSINIYGPLSTSSVWEAAVNFANNNGLIIEFGPPPVSISIYGESCRQFSTAWISDYANEKEHLFIQNQCGLTINNITDAVSGNCFKIIIDGLKAINCAIQRHIKIEHKMDKIGILISKHQLAKKSLLYKKCSIIEFAETMINTYCQNIKDVEIDFGADINQHNDKQMDLKKDFTDLFYDKHNEKCDIYLLESMFPNMRSLAIKNANLNFRTLEDIARRLGDKSALSMLKVISIYPHKTCEYDMKVAVEKYGQRFQQIKYEMKLQNGGLCFFPHDFDQAAYNILFEIINSS